MTQPVHKYRLSLCMPTRNRASFIGATLDSVIEQATDECEIVVVDGASTDNTSEIVASRAKRFSSLRYFRQATKDGMERGFDRAVELAQGEYCWLMPDDDLLISGAMRTVLNALQRNRYSLVVMNSEYRTIDMKTSLGRHDPEIREDQSFRGDELDALFRACWNMIRYGGSTIIRRDVWVTSERAHLLNLYWLHIGIIFQRSLPDSTLVVATPQIMIRMQNQSWLADTFYAFFVAWPKVVASLAISESVKKEVLAKTVSTLTLHFLCVCRAAGQYSPLEYRQYVQPHIRSYLKRVVATCIAYSPRLLLRALVLLQVYVFGSSAQRSGVLRILKQNGGGRTYAGL